MLPRWLIVGWLALAMAASGAAPYAAVSSAPPALHREFRGAWVATVNNIDWPSKPGLSTAQQQQELLSILNRARELRLNVIVLQVRTACDAFYDSKIEPWSEYLTGKMGQAPAPRWDPLEFAVREAHQRGLELHAWFNPFRARHQSGLSPASNTHITKAQPALAKRYGASMWLDPGLREVQDHSMRVILDVVRRYDIDGVHVDDYFYPYPEKDGSNRPLPFPDWTSWNQYQKGGGKLSRDDWRRENVNRFVARMYRDIKAAKPWVKVGISPFGIYRPGYPPQIRGFDQYESLFADPRAWLANGWLDYLAPQLYWRIEPPAQSFPVLLKWWTENNPRQRVIVAGMNTHLVATGNDPWPASEIVRQIDLARRQTGAGGHIHWNVSALMKNKGGLATELSRSTYAHAALPPGAGGTPLAAQAPRVSVAVGKEGARVSWNSSNDPELQFWLVQARRGNQWSSEIVGRTVTSRQFNDSPEAITVRPVDRYGRTGTPTMMARQ